MFSRLFFVTNTKMRTLAILDNQVDAVNRAEYLLGYNPYWGSVYVIPVDCDYGAPNYCYHVIEVFFNENGEIKVKNATISDKINIRINNRG